MGIKGKKVSDIENKYQGKNQFVEKGRWEGQNARATQKAKDSKVKAEANVDAYKKKSDAQKAKAIQKAKTK